MVVSAVVTALEQRPERFNPVRMGLVTDILAEMPDRLMLEGQSLIAAVVVRVDGEGRNFTRLLGNTGKGPLSRCEASCLGVMSHALTRSTGTASTVQNFSHPNL